MENRLLSKVPEITIFFWIIKIMATTVGETGADFLSTTLKLGLIYTSYVMWALLIVSLILQIVQKRYIPAFYWVTVFFMSIVGTLVTDNMIDNLGISLEMSTAIFSGALTLTFIGWYMSEKTLSIHSIHTVKREIFYWLAILFTFALGTASGDLFWEGLKLWYLYSWLIFAGVIGVITFSFYYLKLNAVLAFWIAYILTRPLWASFGDLLSQAPADGWMWLWTVSTSMIFTMTIIALVIYMTLREKHILSASKI